MPTVSSPSQPAPETENLDRKIREVWISASPKAGSGAGRHQIDRLVTRLRGNGIDCHVTHSIEALSGGVNIYPAEIEDALEHHPDVMEVAVFGIPSEEWGESVHAVVVKRPGSTLDAPTLQAFAREHLAGYKVPRSVDFVAEIPKTGSGKVLKRDLRATYWKDHDSKVG